MSIDGLASSTDRTTTAAGKDFGLAREALLRRGEEEVWVRSVEMGWGSEDTSAAEEDCQLPHVSRATYVASQSQSAS
jgi:hypothetical protein